MWNGALSMGTGLSSTWAAPGCASAQASKNNAADTTGLMQILPVVPRRIVQLGYTVRHEEAASLCCRLFARARLLDPRSCATGACQRHGRGARTPSPGCQ